MRKLESRRGANHFNHRMRETHNCKDDHEEEVMLFYATEPCNWVHCEPWKCTHLPHLSTFYGSSYVKCKWLPGPQKGLVNTARAVWPPIPEILGLYIVDDRSWHMTPFVWQIHWYATRVTRFQHAYQAGNRREGSDVIWLGRHSDHYMIKAHGQHLGNW